MYQLKWELLDRQILSVIWTTLAKNVALNIMNEKIAIYLI